MKPNPNSKPVRTPTDGARLLAAIRDLDTGAILAGETRFIWLDHERLLLVAELVGADVQMVTDDDAAQALHVHLCDEVLVLDISGAGCHKLMCLDIWGISAELNSALGLDWLDGSAGA